MTKRKPHRILSLVQWKSSAVLKRVLKLPHVDTAYYALKLLKSQIPYLGRKWKMGNMKIITMIYLGLKPGLVDDYLLVQGGSGSVNVEEALVFSFFIKFSNLIISNWCFFREKSNNLEHWSNRTMPEITLLYLKALNLHHSHRNRRKCWTKWRR